MDASRTTCTVPPVFKNTQGAMLQFIAYGEELNLVHPPKPKDPKQVWKPQWSVKVRLKSTGMTSLLAGDDDSGGKSRSSSKKRQPSKSQDENTNDSRAVDDDAVPDSEKSKSGVGNRLRGLFGF